MCACVHRATLLTLDDVRRRRTGSSSCPRGLLSSVCSGRTLSGSSSRRWDKRRAARPYAGCGGSVNYTKKREPCRTPCTCGRCGSSFFLVSSSDPIVPMFLRIALGLCESAILCQNRPFLGSVSCQAHSIGHLSNCLLAVATFSQEASCLASRLVESSQHRSHKFPSIFRARHSARAVRI